MLKASIVVGMLLAPSIGEAGQLRLRAREHYETIAVRTDDGEATFRGFTNTIDAWYEEPFRFSFGLAGSPLFARLMAKHPPPGFGEAIRLVHLGAEGKVFPFPEAAPVFARLGIYRTTLNPDGPASVSAAVAISCGLEDPKSTYRPLRFPPRSIADRNAGNNSGKRCASSMTSFLGCASRKPSRSPARAAYSGGRSRSIDVHSGTVMCTSVVLPHCRGP